MNRRWPTVLISLFILFSSLEATSALYTHFHLVYDVEMTRYANELKVDATNARIGHVHAPSRTVKLMGVEVKTNSEGFRDREYPLKRNEKKRIIFLGDSLTLGWGVKKEGTFEERLEDRIGSSVPVEIINFGHGNYNTDQEVALFLEKGLQYRPDEVVLFYFINDAEETSPKSQLGFLSRSKFITLFWSRYKALRARVLGDLSFRNYYSKLYTGSPLGWVTAQKALHELRDTCRREGIGLKIVLLPELHDLAHYPFTAEHGKVAEVLTQLEVPYLDITRAFASVADSRSLWVAADDAHPNAEAHRMIAEFTKDFISKDLRK